MQSDGFDRDLGVLGIGRPTGPFIEEELTSYFRRSGSDPHIGAWFFAQRTPVAVFRVVKARSRRSR